MSSLLSSLDSSSINLAPEIDPDDDSQVPDDPSGVPDELLVVLGVVPDMVGVVNVKVPELVVCL